ncbi:2-oxoacid:acceptor oxidoreductase subunit alpha [Candidatus Woesearchaeota archaeon]|nr:MAG: 2-oxoacid:acceptor oxidoreductase subunit alpha [Candidatus Woesearchaeota archaeon]
MSENHNIYIGIILRKKRKKRWKWLQKNRFVWKIAGEAGHGIMSAGAIFSTVMFRSGLEVFCNTEHPSLIRGGHNTYTVRVEEGPLFSQIRLVDLLVALNRAALEKHQSELTPGGAVVFDGEKLNVEQYRDDVLLVGVPLARFAKEMGGSEVMMNLVAIGASLALLKMDLSELDRFVEQWFSKKGDAVVLANKKAAKAGFDFVKEHVDAGSFVHEACRVERDDARILISGNHAVCLGALKAGVKFVGEYPMTPSSSVLHYMAAHDQKFKLVLKHTEDELAAITMSLGASFAGVRAMTCTSGGGFSLMTEALGLAGMAEVPIVVVNVSRPGPSTGLPTRTGQEDLRFMMHASQGEFPRVVLAPGDPGEFFYHTFHAFNLAEKYQLPVIILSDKFAGESPQSWPRFDDHHGLKVERGKLLQTREEVARVQPFKRFAFTEDGVSPRTRPGVEGGIHRITGNEHNEFGAPEEDAGNRRAMVEKRFRKLEALKRELPLPQLYGPKDADVTIIAWGSTKGAVRQAMAWLEEEGVRVNFLHFIYIMPFPREFAATFLREGVKKTLLVEGNYLGQFGSVLKEEVGFEPDAFLHKYDGRPIYPEEVVEKVREVLG